VDRTNIFIFIVLFASLIAFSVNADVEYGSCEDENIVYRVSGLSDAHVARYDEDGDYIDVCFERDFGQDCIDYDEDGINDNVVFRIGQNRDRNAHIEEKNLNTPGYDDLCFGGVECSYKDECDVFLGEECFGSMKRSKNSHVGDCDAYDTKICCSPGCRISNVFWSKNGLTQVTNVNERDIVLMVVEGSSGCSEFDINLKIFLDASIGNVLSINTGFNEDGKIEYGWDARRHCDLHALGCLTEPSFYFEASFAGITLRSEDLRVGIEGSEVSECGDGRINGKEICDIGSESDNSDDIFVRNLECDDEGWDGRLTCRDCFSIDTSSCIGDSGECGDGELNPGESCDGDNYFNRLDSCSELKSIFNGELSCDDCSYSSSECILPDIEGQTCGSCSQCDNIFSNDCSQSVCVNACPGIGSCYYDPGFGEDCKSCSGVISCSDYANELDCEIDRCLLLLDKPCVWEGSLCKENERCRWDCDSVYSSCVNGVKSKISSCRLISGDCSLLLDNPSTNYPDEVICLEPEELFPVFTWFNVFMSVSLLIGYYFVRRKFKSKKI